MKKTDHRAGFLLAASISAFLAACAAGPQTYPPIIDIPPVTQPTDPGNGASGAIEYVSSGHAGMDSWRSDFSSRAMAAGRERAAIEAILSGISPLERYLGSNVRIAGTGVGDQAEFAKPIWDYLRTAVSNTRKATGASRLSDEQALFDQLEARYGVDREVLAAIWGMETNFGSYIGNFDAANTLANMAVEGRRRSFAEGELLALMKMLERGEAERDDLVSGWAGAMGQTQFMPSTYLAHAQDFDGDGKKDVWASRADALASAANYLSHSGYVMNQPWGIEVLVPEGFDYSLANGQDRRMETWTSAGISPIRGGAFQTGGANYAQMWLPAGATGPKFLLFKNFDVFKTYNRADSYALAVGLLSDGVKGQDGPVASWPTDLRPLSKANIMKMQAALNARGYDAGPVDGIAGRRTKGALQRFQKDQGLLADGYPTLEMLDLLGTGSAQVSMSAGSPG